jgi:nitroreductase
MKDHLADPNFNMFYNAGTLIIILAKSEGTNPAGDCWMAAQNLMLAAYEQGLGTCPIGLAWPWLHLPETKGKIGIPVSLTAIAPVIIGYPAEKPEHPPRNEPAVVVWLSKG